MADNLLYEQSNESQITTEPFVSRQVVYVVDQNNGAYNGQIQLDTSSLSNSGKYASYSEAYFEIPLVVTLANNLPAFNAAGGNDAERFRTTTNAFSAGLKAGYWHLIHSLSVEYNNTSVVQLTPFTNMYVHYKMMTSMSQADVDKIGAGLGFFPDSTTSYKFKADPANLQDGSARALLNWATGAGVQTEMYGQGSINNSDFGVLNIAPTVGTIVGGTTLVTIANNTTIANLQLVQTAAGGAANIQNPGVAGDPITGAGGPYLVGAEGGAVTLPATANGIRVNISSSALTGGWIGTASNLGYYQRQQSTSFDPSSNTNFGAILPQGACNTVGKNYFDQSTRLTADAGYVAWYILAKIRLKDVCDFFDKIPLVKGAYLRFIINTNTAIHGLEYTTWSTGGVKRALSSTTNQIVGGTSPLLWASGEAGQGASSLTTNATNYLLANANAKIGLTLQCGIAQVTVGNTVIKHNTLQQCRLYVPLYQMNPSMEEQYLSLNRTKKIVYRDIYQYQTDINGQADFNVLLTNGIPNPKFIVCIPMIRGASNSAITNAGGGNAPYTVGSGGNIVGFIQNTTVADPPVQAVALPTYQSPFATEPATTSPLIAFTNFNIQIAGQNMFIQNQLYDFEQFTNELQSVNAINGGLVTGLTSGLISETDFQYMYRYYICDVSRRLPAEDRVPKSVQILGKNQSTQPITLFTFIEFEKEIEVDLITGQKLS
jgi:hypothetical protein